MKVYFTNDMWYTWFETLKDYSRLEVELTQDEYNKYREAVDYLSQLNDKLDAALEKTKNDF